MGMNDWIALAVAAALIWLAMPKGRRRGAGSAVPAAPDPVQADAAPSAQASATAWTGPAATDEIPLPQLGSEPDSPAAWAVALAILAGITWAAWGRVPAIWLDAWAAAVSAFAATWAAYLDWAVEARAWHPSDWLRFLPHLPTWAQASFSGGDAAKAAERAAFEAWCHEAEAARRKRRLGAWARAAADRAARLLAANHPGLFGPGKPGAGVKIVGEADGEGRVALRLAYQGGTPIAAVHDAWTGMGASPLLAYALGLLPRDVAIEERPGGPVILVWPEGRGDAPVGARDAGGKEIRVPLLPRATADADAESPLGPGLPPLSLLAVPDGGPAKRSERDLERLASRAVEELILLSGVQVEPVGAVAGASVLQAIVRVPAGTQASKLVAQAANLAAAIGYPAVRIAPVFDSPPGINERGNLLGIEIGLDDIQVATVRPGPLWGSALRGAMGDLPVVIGESPAGSPVAADLARFPHLLVAGQTGGGKSVFLHGLILQLLLQFPPERMRLWLADAKGVELSIYEGLPHLGGPVVTDAGGMVDLITQAVDEMERRYVLLQKHHVRDIREFNARAAGDGGPLPYVVAVVDEFADFLDQLEGGDRAAFEAGVQRLAQKARAAGVHLILTTQRPTKDALPTRVKANLPVRIAFRTSGELESRVILDAQGAEALRGRGDLLFLGPDGRVVRAQSPWVPAGVPERVAAWWAERASEDAADVDAAEGGMPGGPDAGGQGAGETGAADSRDDGHPHASPPGAASAAVARLALDELMAWLDERREELVASGELVVRDGWFAIRQGTAYRALSERGFDPERVLPAMLAAGMIDPGDKRHRFTRSVRIGQGTARMMVFRLPDA
ncbi:MAG: DNA translocase FtsK [Bacillota bacterium]|nr:DNA translocase FtsK [Bacillota bacterium]